MNYQDRVWLNRLDDGLVDIVSGHKAGILYDFLDGHQELVARQYLKSQQVPYDFWGGYPDAERKRLLLGQGTGPDRDSQFGLVPLLLSAKGKEAGEIGHRDYLGALMSLGFVREKMGDLLVAEAGCLLFISEELVDYCLNQSLKIKQKIFHFAQADQVLAAFIQKEKKEIFATVASLRLDNILAQGFSLSRSQAAQAVKEGRIQVNHVLCNSASMLCKSDDTISFRGKGKLVIGEVHGFSKKDKIKVSLWRYV